MLERADTKEAIGLNRLRLRSTGLLILITFSIAFVGGVANLQPVVAPEWGCLSSYDALTSTDWKER